MAQGGNYSFGRGSVGPEQFKQHKKFMSGLRRASRKREQKRVAALSDAAIVRRMASKIVEVAKRGDIQRRDFHQAGIPDSRIDNNVEAAYALAARTDGAIAGMLVQP